MGSVSDIPKVPSSTVVEEGVATESVSGLQSKVGKCSCATLCACYLGKVTISAWVICVPL